MPRKRLHIGYIIGILLYGMMVIFTHKFLPVKLAIMCLLIFCGVQSGNFYVSKRVKSWAVLYISYNIFIFIYSIIRGNPSPFTAFNTDIVEPIIYSMLVFVIPSNFLVLLRKVLPFFLIFTIGLGFLAGVKFNMSGSIDDKLFSYGAAGRPGFPIIAITGTGVVTFMVMYFYLLSGYVLNFFKHNIFLTSIILLGIPYVLLTSRRALILNFVLVFGIIWFIVAVWRPKQFRLERKSMYKYSFWLFILIGIFIVYLVSLDLMNEDFLTFFQSAFESDDDGPRTDQAKALIEGWLDNPIIGNGIGINARVVRSDLYVGAYELGYHYMLFSKGIIGIGLFFYLIWFSIKWTFDVSVKYNLLRDGICVSISLMMLLIACASNPYLGSFDFMYVLFWPLAYVNAYDRDCFRLRKRQMSVKREVSNMKENSR